MAIITISRGSYSKGKEIAEKVAQELGYECVGRDILLSASEEFNVPEVKLTRAIHDAPSFFKYVSHSKEKYVTFIEAEMLKHVKRDNIVYHGLAGHFFVKGISHVLKVRIIADIEERVRLEMEREDISRAEALRILKKDDDERVKWSKSLYGIDTRDSSLYDLVIHIQKFSVKNAVDMICQASSLEQFQATPESQQNVDDLALAAQIKAALVDVKRDLRVSAKSGRVFVKGEAPRGKEEILAQEIDEISKTITGVKETKIDIRGLPSWMSGGSGVSD
ncbi:MAG: cytidylate kinase-like family protein [Deltaproteobacteria bacterium]|nr:cytidylate kinase-like family protein [Deltaproteobacteria bacterium]